MSLSEKQMKRALLEARQQRNPQLYDHPRFGEVWITKRAISAYRHSLRLRKQIVGEATVKHDIAVHAYIAWIHQLQIQTVGQKEILFPGFELHIAASDDDDGIYVDIEPWFPYC